MCARAVWCLLVKEGGWWNVREIFDHLSLDGTAHAPKDLGEHLAVRRALPVWMGALARRGHVRVRLPQRGVALVYGVTPDCPPPPGCTLDVVACGQHARRH